MQPETKFKKKVQDRLKAEFTDIYFIKIQMVALRGVPDIIGCYRGKFFAFELKVPPNKIKVGSLQWDRIRLIKLAGGLAKEVNPGNLEETIEELKCF